MDNERTVVITGSARRLGKEIAFALAREGYSLVIHSTNETEDSRNTLSEIRSLGVQARHLSANFNDPEESADIFGDLFMSDPSIFALINNAAVFDGGGFLNSNFDEWERILDINLSTPYLLSLNFARSLNGKPGRIINMLDWRALRPGKDHFAYTISKAALASMTKAMALALAPEITVNGLALGAILPPADAGKSVTEPVQANGQQSMESGVLKSIIAPVPADRWAEIHEVTDTVSFLLSGPAYITGEIIHIDGGRHLV